MRFVYCMPPYVDELSDDTDSVGELLDDKPPLLLELEELLELDHSEPWLDPLVELEEPLDGEEAELVETDDPELVETEDGLLEEFVLDEDEETLVEELVLAEDS